MKNKKLLISAIAVLSIALLLMGEAVSRIYYFTRISAYHLMLSDNRALVYEHKPSISFTNNYGIKVKYNSLGFSGREPGPKRKGVLRILALGDSVTDAAYLPEDERYLSVVSGFLESEAGIRNEVFNAAVAGYNSRQQLELFREKGVLIGPDLVIVGVCLNDYVRTAPMLKKTFFGGVRENFRDGSKARHLDFLYQRSDLYKLLYDSLYNLRRKYHTRSGFEAYMEKYAFDIKNDDLSAWKDSFISMAMTAGSVNARILFVIFPLQNQVASGSQDSYKPLSDFFRSQGFDFIDLMGDFKAFKTNDEPLYMDRDLIHPSALGHKVAGRAIGSYLAEKLAGIKEN